MNIQAYSIKDIEHITGIKAHTIRIWEERYKLLVPARSSTNIRFYSDEDLKKLLNISILLNRGYKISKLAALTDQQLNDQVRSTFEVSDYEALINGLVVDMIGFDPVSFKMKLNESILAEGFENTVYHVVYPFFTRVGILWITNSINPAQEHFVSNIIKEKFFSAIDSLDTTLPAARTFLLFLPENEQHELGLLLAYYMIRKQGHKVIYIGQNVPIDDVVKTGNVTKADYLITHLTSLMEKKELADYLGLLAARLPGVRILVSGQQVLPPSAPRIRRIKYLDSPADLSRLLESITEDRKAPQKKHR